MIKAHTNDRQTLAHKRHRQSITIHALLAQGTCIIGTRIGCCFFARPGHCVSCMAVRGLLLAEVVPSRRLSLPHVIRLVFNYHYPPLSPSPITTFPSSSLCYSLVQTRASCTSPFHGWGFPPVRPVFVEVWTLLLPCTPHTCGWWCSGDTGDRPCARVACGLQTTTGMGGKKEGILCNNDKELYTQRFTAPRVRACLSVR